MERLGLGPLAIQEKNPKIIYARLTGYGMIKYLIITIFGKKMCCFLKVNMESFLIRLDMI